MLTRGRLWIVYSLLAILLGGHLYDLARNQEHWPFSNYPMFAGIAQAELNTYQLMGLTRSADGGEREVVVDYHALPALPPYKVQNVFRRYDIGSSKADPVKLRKVLSEYLAAYEKRRELGLHSAPPLVGLRLYLLHIPIQIPLTAVDLKSGHGDDPRLAMEVRADGKVN